MAEFLNCTRCQYPSFLAQSKHYGTTITITYADGIQASRIRKKIRDLTVEGYQRSCLKCSAFRDGQEATFTLDPNKCIITVPSKEWQTFLNKYEDIANDYGFGTSQNHGHTCVIKN